ncbi:uncharacterized protein [Ptychodera flava]|uniref:uncharacterized protein n=1 Tax=Ptychodera flava TaxID=63121 RepID=UPI003969D694
MDNTYLWIGVYAAADNFNSLVYYWVNDVEVQEFNWEAGQPDNLHVTASPTTVHTTTRSIPTTAIPATTILPVTSSYATAKPSDTLHQSTSKVTSEPSSSRFSFTPNANLNVMVKNMMAAESLQRLSLQSPTHNTQVPSMTFQQTSNDQHQQNTNSQNSGSPTSSHTTLSSFANERHGSDVGQEIMITQRTPEKPSITNRIVEFDSSGGEAVSTTKQSAFMDDTQTEVYVIHSTDGLTSTNDKQISKAKNIDQSMVSPPTTSLEAETVTTLRSRTGLSSTDFTTSEGLAGKPGVSLLSEKFSTGQFVSQKTRKIAIDVETTLEDTASASTVSEITGLDAIDAKQDKVGFPSETSSEVTSTKDGSKDLTIKTSQVSSTMAASHDATSARHIKWSTTDMASILSSKTGFREDKATITTYMHPSTANRVTEDKVAAKSISELSSIGTNEARASEDVSTFDASVNIAARQSAKTGDLCHHKV